MNKIVCLMGKSGCGKNTIFEKLCEMTSLRPISIYTTRPKRQNEVDGKEYHFINEKQLQEYREKGQIIEERVYHTVNGLWYYATINDGQFDLEESALLIGTLEMYQVLVDYFGKTRIIPVYIHVDEKVRKTRLEIRESIQEKPNYKEIHRRINADNKDFSEEKLRKAGIQTYYENNDLDTCVRQIIKQLYQVL